MRPEPLVRRFDFEEIIQPDPKFFELDRCDTGQRVSRHWCAELCDDERAQPHGGSSGEERHEQTA